jgi:hypothetical protein
MLVAKGDLIDMEERRKRRKPAILRRRPLRVPDRTQPYHGSPSQLRALKRAKHGQRASDIAAFQDMIRSLNPPQHLGRNLMIAGGATLAGSVALSGGLHARAAHRRRQKQQRVEARTNRGAANVGKRLVDEETHFSLPRAAMAGSGMAAIAWGGSRSKALGRGLRAGAGHGRIDPRVRRALETAERTRHMIQTETEPLGRIAGRGIGRMPQPLRLALHEVPQPLRPATASLAGAILVQHASPVRRKTYTPVGD